MMKSQIGHPCFFIDKIKLLKYALQIHNTKQKEGKMMTIKPSFSEKKQTYLMLCSVSLNTHELKEPIKLQKKRYYDAAKKKQQKSLNTF